MNNFVTFFTQAVKDKIKKVKKGRYKGQRNNPYKREIQQPGVTFNPNAQASKLSAPSASTYAIKG